MEYISDRIFDRIVALISIATWKFKKKKWSQNLSLIKYLVLFVCFFKHKINYVHMQKKNGGYIILYNVMFDLLFFENHSKYILLNLKLKSNWWILRWNSCVSFSVWKLFSGRPIIFFFMQLNWERPIMNCM